MIVLLYIYFLYNVGQGRRSVVEERSSPTLALMLWEAKDLTCSSYDFLAFSCRATNGFLSSLDIVFHFSPANLATSPIFVGASSPSFFFCLRSFLNHSKKKKYADIGLFGLELSRGFLPLPALPFLFTRCFLGDPDFAPSAARFLLTYKRKRRRTTSLRLN